MDMKTSKRIPPGTPKHHRLTSENRIKLRSHPFKGWYFIKKLRLIPFEISILSPPPYIFNFSG